MTDGIISLAENKYPHKISIPMVNIGGAAGAIYYNVISSNIETGIYEVLEYLMSLVHLRIGFVSEKNTNSKLKYFRSATARFKLPADPPLIFISDKRFEQIGWEGAQHCLKQTELPTAILTAYDEIAIGVVHTFIDAGIKISGDISIIGTNDIPSTSYASVPLTTILTYCEEIICLGVKLLLDKIKNPNKYMTQCVPVRCELIGRSTCAKPTDKTAIDIKLYC